MVTCQVSGSRTSESKVHNNRNQTQCRHRPMDAECPVVIHTVSNPALTSMRHSNSWPEIQRSEKRLLIKVFHNVQYSKTLF